MTSLKEELTQELRLLQGQNDAGTKRSAYKRIIEIVNELTKSDKSFTFDSKVLEKYSQFAPNDVPKQMKQVQWVEVKTLPNVKESYNRYVATAVEICKERHPNLDSDNDKFGQIVYAITTNLIAIDKD